MEDINKYKYKAEIWYLNKHEIKISENINKERRDKSAPAGASIKCLGEKKTTFNMRFKYSTALWEKLANV